MERKPMIIRAAVYDDVQSMYAISCSVHLSTLYKTLIPSTSYSKYIQAYTPHPQKCAIYSEKLLNHLHDTSWHVWVAVIDSRVSGFAITHENEDSLTIQGLFVDSEWQGKGIGKALFEKCLYGCDGDKPVFLDVIKNNERARTMYESAGFRATVAKQNAFYGAPIIQMRKY